MQRKAPVVPQLDMRLSGSCGCCTSFWNCPGTWHVAGMLQQLSQVWLCFSNKHQSVTMQESVHNLCTGALAPVLEGQEAVGQLMDPGRQQLTLQLVS